MKLPGSHSRLKANMPSAVDAMPSRIINLWPQAINHPALDRTKHAAFNPRQSEGEGEE